MNIMIKGRSMEPTFFEGETYKVRRIDPETVKPGNIVVAYIKDEFVVKRISAVYLQAVDLKGDNRGHSTDFEFVPKKRIHYKVIRPTFATWLLRRWRNANKR